MEQRIGIHTHAVGYKVYAHCKVDVDTHKHKYISQQSFPQSLYGVSTFCNELSFEKSRNFSQLSLKLKLMCAHCSAGRNVLPIHIYIHCNTLLWIFATLYYTCDTLYNNYVQCTHNQQLYTKYRTCSTGWRRFIEVCCSVYIYVYIYTHIYIYIHITIAFGVSFIQSQSPISILLVSFQRNEAKET